MVDPQAVDQAVTHQPQHQLVGGGEHLRILLADAGQLVDVEEAAVQAGLRIHVEELLAQLRIGPEAVGVVSRHVVGDNVEDDPQAGVAGVLGQRPEPLLAPQVLRETSRVDHVVAVGGPGPRLKRRRQVEVGDAEISQIGHELTRLAEAEIRRQLEPVGRAHLGSRHHGVIRGRGAHATRFSMTIEWGMTGTSVRAP